MDADVRRSFDMGTRTHTFLGSIPAVTNPDFGVLLTQLTGLLARGTALAAQQRDGFVERAAASARKRELQRTIRSVHVAHLAQAGQLAARDDHEIGSTFRLAPAKGFGGFRTAVGSMAEAAERHREALVKRGMSGTVLVDMGEAVKQFDLAVERGNAGRAAHVAASAELRVVGAEIVQVVRMLDAIARLEFKDDASQLAAWKSVSRRQAVARDGSAAEVPAPAPTMDGGPATPAAGDVRPAA